jgi:large subunit ribosomal protein L23
MVTEKSTVLREKGKYVFEVNSGANKYQVKQAVETAFDVEVTGVNVVIRPGKMRRFGRKRVKTPALKKAIVTLASDDKIEFFEGV